MSLAAMKCRFDSAVHARTRGNATYCESALAEQSSPLRLGTFATAEHRHHGEVDNFGRMWSVILRHDELEKEQLSTLASRAFDGVQDTQHRGIIPVVQHGRQH